MTWASHSLIELITGIVLRPVGVVAWVTFLLALVLAFLPKKNLEGLVALCVAWHLVLIHVVWESGRTLAEAAGTMGRWNPNPNAIWEVAHSQIQYNFGLGVLLSIVPILFLVGKPTGRDVFAVRCFVGSSLFCIFAVAALLAFASWLLLETAVDLNWGPRPWERLMAPEAANQIR